MTMQVVAHHAKLYEFPTEALIIFYTSLDDDAIVQVNGLLEGAISQQVNSGLFSPTLGQLMVLPTFGRLAALHVMILGWGEAPPTISDAQSALLVAFRKAYDWAADEMAIELPPYFSLAEGVQLIKSAAWQARPYIQKLTILTASPEEAQEVQTLLDKNCET